MRPPGCSCRPSALTVARAESIDGVDRTEQDAGALTLVTRRPAEVLAELARIEALDGLQVRSGTLEDVFVSLTGRPLLDDPEGAP